RMSNVECRKAKTAKCRTNAHRRIASARVPPDGRTGIVRPSNLPRNPPPAATVNRTGQHCAAGRLRHFAACFGDQKNPSASAW
ncbi:hypothetical protein, partial [Burkholderia anthina]|uniref:hypothetical protein n=1 Tax=Burkholderia anthina TaxID=179879 RepID=UPI00333EFF56